MRADRITSIPTCGVAFDVETHKVQPGLAFPPLVVGSWARFTSGKVEGGILRDAGQVNDAALASARSAFEWLLDAPDAVIVGANIAFDMMVMATDSARRGVDLMPKIFAAYFQERVFDVLIAEQLHAVGRGHLGKDPRTGKALHDPETGAAKRGAKYGLEVVTDLVLGRVNAKANDFWRTRYALLEGVPVERWPFEARVYPVDDACNTLEVALAQLGVLPNVGPHRVRGSSCEVCGVVVAAGMEQTCRATWPRMNLSNHAVEVFKAFVLSAGAGWGNRTDPITNELLLRVQREAHEADRPRWVAAGLVRPDGTEPDAPLFRAVALAYGASGDCKVCTHARRWFDPGRVPSEGTSTVQCRVCRPTKKKPADPGCECCEGTGKQPDKSTTCKACIGTALDLDSATGVPRTEPSKTWPKGQVKTSADVLVDSGNEDLVDFSVWGEDDKIPRTYGPKIRYGYDVPMTHYPNPILDTLRVSYNGITQTLPRQISARLRYLLEEYARRGAPYVMGVRDNFVPRPGRVFYTNDFKGGELVCHAESCKRLVGYSKLGDALLRGLDVHSVLGATMMGAPYEYFVQCLDGKHGPDLKKKAKLFRQAAKPGNFGLPGRMGPQKLVVTQRKGGPDTPWPDGPSDLDGRGLMGYRGLRFCLTIGDAKRCGGPGNMIYQWARRDCEPTCKTCVDIGVWIRETWLKQYDENDEYLKVHVPQAEAQGFHVLHHSGLIRGSTDGGSIANGWFQSYLARITTLAAIRVAHEQYVRQRVVTTEWGSAYAGEWSPLYDSRGEIFAHDELIGEADIPVAHDAAERCREIMVEEFKRGCPEHAAACEAEPTLMPRWYKAAELVRHCEPCARDYKGEDCPGCGRRGRMIPWTPPFLDELRAA